SQRPSSPTDSRAPGGMPCRRMRVARTVSLKRERGRVGGRKVDMTPESQATTVLHHLDQHLAMPRLVRLKLTRDCSRLVPTVTTINKAGTGYAPALWGLDPTGEQPAHRITRSAKGEAGAAFSSTGTLYFTSARPNPDADDETPEA